MESSDFDPKLVELVLECSHAILGGLAYEWHVVDVMKANQEDSAEFVQAQILLTIKEFFDTIKSEEQLISTISGCACNNCDIDYPSCNHCVGA